MPLGREFEATLRAAQCGADWAVAALYRDLQPSVLRYLTAQEPNEGEDLASQVWLEAGTCLGGFEGDESAFRCWLFTIARRRLIDLRRSRARRRTQPVPLEQLAERPDPTEPFERAEGGAALRCLAALPAEQAEIVLLRVVGGLDSYEVAAVTGKKPGTVRVIQKRALERLAELLPSETAGAVTP
jgi:RNA polymerase sigma-70 factor, ECF subfamily